MTRTDECLPHLPYGPSLARRLLNLVGRHSSLSRERRALKNLDDRLLEDIGLNDAGRYALLKQFGVAPDRRK